MLEGRLTTLSMSAVAPVQAFFSTGGSLRGRNDRGRATSQPIRETYRLIRVFSVVWCQIDSVTRVLPRRRHE